MESNIADKILAIVQVLSVEQQLEVLKFIDNLEAEKESKEENDLKSVFKKIEERSKNIPDDVWKEMPEDGSEQHDHYLYGTPKRKKV
jgi:hypothetical protein